MSSTETLAATAAPWSIARKMLFRFFTCYLILSCFPFPLMLIPGSTFLTNPLFSVQEYLAAGLGKYLFHIRISLPPAMNGSGDTTLNYLTVLLNLFVAAGLMLAWNIADRKRRNYEQLQYWVMVLARYYVAYALISYGYFKLFKTQFPYPGAMRLTQRYGDSSPMGLAWTFLGYSYGYNLFMGFAEISAGLLLCFRHTKTLGALLAVCVTANILAINLCFDVPVKLYSGHLLLFSGCILAPDIRRLLQVFVCNKAVPARELSRPLQGRNVHIAVNVLKTILLLQLFYGKFYAAYRSYAATKEPGNVYLPQGCYTVASFIQNGDTISTATGRWELIDNNRPGYLRIRNSAQETESFYAEQDSTTQTLQLTNISDEAVVYQVNISRDNKQQLLLRGQWGKDSIAALLAPLQTDSMLLMKRGFHWINETPFNK